jgi:hypothetical protein
MRGKDFGESIGRVSGAVRGSLLCLKRPQVASLVMPASYPWCVLGQQCNDRPQMSYL